MAVAPAQDPQALNAAQRFAVLSRAVEMKQQIFSQTINPANQTTVNIVPRNVGLVKRFIVEVTGTLVNTDGANASTKSQLGLANLLSNITFTDLNNNQRINTSGWHLAALKQAKSRRPSFQGYDLSDSSGMLQNAPANFPVITFTAPAKGATQAFRAVYEIPLAYSDVDLRGAVYANVVNAVMQLQLNVNTAPMTAAGSDSTLSITGGAAGNLGTSLTITVYQVYLDQLPVGKNGVVLPILDLSTVYELKNTNFTAISVNQDFPVAYANFRDFLSTFALYNGTGADGGLANGSDVNYWALQSANFTNLWKIDPLLAAQETREAINDDLPLGLYYFQHKKPISTTQYGNMELILNPSTAAAGAYLQIGWEDFAYVNTLTQASSLAG